MPRPRVGRGWAPYRTYLTDIMPVTIFAPAKATKRYKTAMRRALGSGGPQGGKGSLIRLARSRPMASGACASGAHRQCCDRRSIFRATRRGWFAKATATSARSGS